MRASFVDDGEGGGGGGGPPPPPPANSTPTPAANGGASVAEGSTVTITAAMLDYDDAEQPDTAIAFTVTIAPANGSLRLNGSALAAGGSFTQADINAGGLSFTHDGGETSSASFGFFVSDGAGGSVMDQSFTIGVTPVNDRPSGTDATFTFNEDGSRTLYQADFGFSDPAENHGFDGVAIGQLPTNGVLLLNGAAITGPGTYVTAAQVAAGQLIFRSDANENGAPYATFTFQVSDTGGFGTDLSPNTLTFNVTAQNDAPVFAAAPFLTRVSTTSAGGNSNAAISFEPGDVSADGTRVLFSSDASNLVADDTNGFRDVFLKDLATGAVTRVSTSASGAEGQNFSNDALFSPDGTKIVFSSGANNLVAGDSGSTDVFVKTLATGAIERVSASGSGFTLSGGTNGIFSPDGTKVAFQANSQIFVKTLSTGVLELVSKNMAGDQGNNTSSNVVFSADGTKILFISAATNLVAGDSNGFQDVFVKDLATGVVTLVSIAPDGSQANGSSFEAAFSPDGTKVVFRNNADNLSAADTDASSDIFMRDLVANTTTLISADANGTGANLSINTLSVRPFSPDGSIVYFATGASNLVAGDTNFVIDVFGKNLLTGAVTRISVRENGTQSQSSNAFDAIASASGTVLFRTGDKLVTSDTDNLYDQYIANPANGPITYGENGPAVALVGVVNVSDVDSANFDGGMFSAVITAGSASGDRLTIAQAGGITTSGNSVRFNGTEIGLLTASATSLSVALDADANAAALKALAEAIRFDSTSEGPGTATRTTTFTLADGDGGSTSFTRTVAVTPSNDAPSGADATLTINEDTPRAFTAADFGFSDLDGGILQSVVIATLPTAGTGTLKLFGVEVTAGQAIATGNLPQLVFAPAANASGNGTASFTFQVRDNGATGGTNQNTDQNPNTITFNVNAVNDAPTGANNSDTVLDNAVLTFTAADFSTGFADQENNQFSGVRIATLPGSGTLKLNGVAVAPGADVSLADLDAAGLTFEPAAGSAGTTPTFTYRVRDDGGTANGGVDLGTENIFTIAVQQSNAAPVIDLNGADAGTGVTVTVLEDVGGLVAPDAVVSDLDSFNFDGGTLTAGYSAAGTVSDYVSVQDQGGRFSMTNRIGVSFNNGFEFYYNTVLVGTAPFPSPGEALVVTFNVNATPASAQALVRAVTTFNVSDTPPTGARPLTFTLTDGDGGSASAIAQVTTTAVNDAPAIDLDDDIDGTGASASYTEQGLLILVAPDAIVADADSLDFESGTLTVALDADRAGDVLRINNGGTGPGQIGLSGSEVTHAGVVIGTWTGGTGGTALIVTFNGTADNAAVQALVRNIAFENQLDDPSGAARTVSFTLTDGDGGTGNTAEAAIAVTPVNDITAVTADSATTDEANAKVIDVLANDTALDAPAKAVTHIAGTAVMPGGSITLGSGAKVTLNMDGTLTYDPNGAFDALTAAGSGATNLSDTDSFSYTEADGATATVTVTVNGIASPDDVLAGDENDNTITGTPGADTIEGAGGDDVLNGEAGDDVIEGGAGDDTMNGGEGNDTLRYDGLGNDPANGGAGTDTLVVDFSDATRAIVDNPNAAAFNFDASYWDEAGNSVAFTSIERIDITTGAFDDRITTYGGNDTIRSGAGNDQLDGGLGADLMVGGTGDDIYQVDDLGDVVTELSSEGIDTVVTGLGSRNDYTSLYTLPDNVENLTGTNAAGQGVYGNALDNVITMAAGADLVVINGGGADTVDGGAGNDFVFAGDAWSASDKVDGGADYDTVGFSGGGTFGFGATAFTAVEQLSFYRSPIATQSVSYRVTMHDGNVAANKTLLASFQSLGANDSVTFDGTAELNGNFTVFGGAGMDEFIGGGGRDVLYGNAGMDSLNGGGGNDILIGGNGADRLTGGAGKDLYRFESVNHSHANTDIDTITDFNVGASDERIDLLAIDASTDLDGDQAFTFIGTNAAFTGVAGQLRVVEESGKWFVQGDTDGDGAADLVIQVSNGGDIVWGLNNFLL